MPQRKPHDFTPLPVLHSTYVRAIVGKSLLEVVAAVGCRSIADHEEQERGEEKRVDHVVSIR